MGFIKNAVESVKRAYVASAEFLRGCRKAGQEIIESRIGTRGLSRLATVALIVAVVVSFAVESRAGLDTDSGADALSDTNAQAILDNAGSAFIQAKYIKFAIIGIFVVFGFIGWMMRRK